MTYNRHPISCTFVYIMDRMLSLDDNSGINNITTNTEEVMSLCLQCEYPDTDIISLGRYVYVVMMLCFCQNKCQQHQHNSITRNQSSVNKRDSFFLIRFSIDFMYKSEAF